MATRDLNVVFKDYTPLHYATHFGDLEEVRNLVEDSGCDVNTKTDFTKKSPIFVASQNGHLDIVKYLIKQEANVNAANIAGFSPLFIAAGNGHLDVVKHLVQSGADMYAVTKNRLSILDAAARNTDIFQFFIDNKIEIEEFCKKTKSTPLHSAARYGNVEVSKCLVKEGKINVNTKKTCDVTPLYRAAQSGSLDIVKLLIENGANINAVRKNTGTALYAASRKGHFEVVKFLIEHNADINLTHANRLGFTPLYGAVAGNNKEIVDYLIQNNADLDEPFRNGNTPLHVAAQNGSLEIVKMLVFNNARVNVNNKGHTPLKLAVVRNHREVSLFLKKVAKFVV